MNSALALDNTNGTVVNDEAAKVRDHVGRSTVDPQVVVRPTRRVFTSEYKRRILDEAAKCVHPGELGELLRREGLYSSSLTKFRHQLRTGRLSETGQAHQSKQQAQLDEERRRDKRIIASLQADKAKLLALVELQKKLSDLIALQTTSEQSE